MSCLVRLGGAVAVAVLLAFPAQAQSLKPWRQAMILPKADAGFFLMAAKRGFAEREGLKVEVLDVKDDPIGMKALLSDEVDSYEGVYGAIAASARGADVKLLGCNWHAAPYVMLARPGIDRIEDLRGKSIAASSPGTPPDMVARAALVRAKVPPAEVKIAAVGGDRDRFTALRAAWSTPRWCPTSTCRCRRSRACACWSRRARCCPSSCASVRWSPGRRSTSGARTSFASWWRR
jgi:NitT/TauT family transport system substrate-binding protein